MNYFCINKSGKILDVYDNYKNGSVIGHIYNREAFGWNYNWGGDQYYLNIAFYGFINTGLDYGSEWDNIPFYGSW